MKKRILWALALLAVILLFFGASRLYKNLSADYAPQQLTTEESDDTPLSMAPDFTVLSWEGEEVSLSSFRGKPVVVNFWASWCPPCKAEMPSFQKAYEKYGEDVIFMMVDMTDGSRETTKTGKAFIEKEGYTFPVYFDLYANAAVTFGASSIPVSFFIDAEGHAIARAAGMMDEESLEQAIGMILKE